MVSGSKRNYKEDPRAMPSDTKTALAYSWLMRYLTELGDRDITFSRTDITYRIGRDAGHSIPSLLSAISRAIDSGQLRAFPVWTKEGPRWAIERVSIDAFQSHKSLSDMLSERISSEFPE